MTPYEFIAAPQVEEALRRASRCAGTPVSVRAVQDRGKTHRLAAVGQCAICRFVAGITEGRRQCRRLRGEASLLALRRGTPVPFVCHLGFACAAMRVLPGQGLVLTFGPFCPSEAPQTLEDDVKAGLAALGVDAEDAPPAPLADVPLVPADAVPEIAAWTAECIQTLWQQAQCAERVVSFEPEPQEESKKRRKKGRTPSRDPYQAADIVAALAGGNQNQARELVRAGLSEAEAGRKAAPKRVRARCIALVAAALEAAERAQIDTTVCWERFPGLLAQTPQVAVIQDLTAAAMKVLGVIKRKAARGPLGKQDFTALNEIVLSRIADPPALGEVAAQLGVPPSTLTRRLQRRFGVSFTQYIGRLRVDKAKDLLRRTKLTVNEIARRVGIDDASNFGALFRKFEGMSPIEYRKRFGRS